MEQAATIALREACPVRSTRDPSEESTSLFFSKLDIMMHVMAFCHKD